MTLQPKKAALPLAILLLLAAGGAAWWWTHPRRTPEQLTLYGNIDIREVQAAFNDSGRIRRLLVQEGDRVSKGALLAQMDPVRFQDAVGRARAAALARQQVLARLLAGSRPEEIAEARAAVAAARAALGIATITWKRQRALAAERYVPKQDLDRAAATLRTARASLDRARQALLLAIRGPRKEDVAAARHQLQADRASLALAQRELADTRLLAPAAGVIQDRILEPGDMASPQIPVFTLALDNPVWARAYLPEKALGQVRPGMRAWIRSDSFPGHRFRGWIGFISPTAEFTPRTVETTELRTDLVYRVRVYACNPQHRLRLGMPVTVQIPFRDNPPREMGPHPCRH